MLGFYIFLAARKKSMTILQRFGRDIGFINEAKMLKNCDEGASKVVRLLLVEQFELHFLNDNIG